MLILKYQNNLLSLIWKSWSKSLSPSFDSINKFKLLFSFILESSTNEYQQLAESLVLICSRYWKSVGYLTEQNCVLTRDIVDRISRVSLFKYICKIVFTDIHFA